MRCFTDWNPYELKHFGIRGMKWGQRRYQNEDGSLTSLGQQRYGNGNTRRRLGIKHDLNKLDREQTTAKARYDYYNAKATKKLAKANRKLEKLQNSQDQNKIAKQESKIAKITNGVAKKASDYKKLLESSQKMTNKILKNATAKGYSIRSRDCVRSVNTGRNAASSVLGAVSALTIGVGVGFHQSAVGKHYRVVNDGYGTQTHRSRRFGSRMDL